MTIEIARTAKNIQSVNILPQMVNRHGLITGATGTGKTVTLQRMAEQFSLLGVPVFLADVKGDLAGIAEPAQPNDKIKERLQALKVTDWQAQGNPVEFWDIQGALGHPLRATISDMGPLLLSRLLGLNDTQEGVLQLVFKVADDQGLLLLDVKDLRAMLQHVGDHAQEYTTQYGLIAAASIGAIQRGLLGLASQGAEAFFGEPMLNIEDLIQLSSGDMRGCGVINVMAAEKIMTTPALYAIFLLWLMAELFERLPEVGDAPKPKMVFFFDEAHLLFQDAPPALLQKVEQVVRLIRSKGVGVYFVTQNPMDVPETVLAQLGHRVHHAMRAFTPKEQKTVKTVAETLRANPDLNMEKALMEMGVGEALISFLDEKGRPGMVEQALVLPPMSRIGPLTAAERQQNLQASPLTGHYEKQLDRVSAYEKLQQTAEATTTEQEGGKKEGGLASTLGNVLLDRTGPRGGRQEGILSSAARSAARSIGSQLGRQIIRGVLGSILGGRK